MQNKIALVQMTSTPDRAKNLENALAFTAKAAQNEADLVAFPENFLVLGNNKLYVQTAESIPGPTVEIFQEQAVKNNISILMGSLYEKNPQNPEKVFNTSVLIDRSGQLLATYRKIHLFDVELHDVTLMESELVDAGQEFVVCDHEIGKIGLTICYDIRFPNLYQKITDLGAQIIFVPAAFTVPTGKAHWLDLLKIRAVENQVYIAAPAQFGKHSETRESFGNSVIFDPWGDTVALSPDTTGIIYGHIELENLKKIRNRMPVRSHRVPGIDF